MLAVRERCAARHAARNALPGCTTCGAVARARRHVTGLRLRLSAAARSRRRVRAPDTLSRAPFLRTNPPQAAQPALASPPPPRVEVARALAGWSSCSLSAPRCALTASDPSPDCCIACVARRHQHWAQHQRVLTTAWRTHSEILPKSTSIIRSAATMADGGSEEVRRSGDLHGA